MKRQILLILLSIIVHNIYSQNITPQDLIAKSIKYHDPTNVLFRSNVKMEFLGIRPGGSESETEINFNIKDETFQMENDRDGLEIKSFIDGDKVTIIVDGKKEYSDALKKKYRLNPDRVTMMKDYYQYLWLMPMKLNDPGTIIDPDVKKVDFFGNSLLQIRVSYTPEVGKDTWYFYFHPSTYAMQGYRFYHDEEKNDGEYILLEEEAIFNGVRLPKKRIWYTHKEDKHLGTDILDTFSF